MSQDDDAPAVIPVTEPQAVCVDSACTLRDAMLRINDNCKGIVLVVDAERRLLFTVTDGDLRRAMLQGIALDTTLAEWAKQVPEQGNRRPTTLPRGASLPEVLRAMREADVRHLPLLDHEGRVAGLAVFADLVREGLDVSAVIMAGGFGTRLYPLTAEVPKPMLPVGDRPLLERIVGQLRQAEIHDVAVTTHYKHEKIMDHFGDGHRFGVAIDYINEEQPLGTAGALGLRPAPQTTQLVINGDILTDVNLRSMLEFHRENDAVLTAGIRPYEVQVPYGVADMAGEQVLGFREKPTLRFFASAGIYLLEPEAHAYIARGRRSDMPDLIQALLNDKRRVVGFPVSEYWLDIGRPGDYEKAQIDAAGGRIR